MQADSSPTLSADGRRFVDAARYAVVATINPDGSVLQAVVWYRLDGDTIVMNSRAGRTWPANLGRDPRVSFIVAEGEDYIEMRGVATIDDDPVRGQRTMAELSRIYEPDEDPVAQAKKWADQHRVTIELRPGRIYERFLGNFLAR
jgi:PPOX class probable F420-dependent enzyme